MLSSCVYLLLRWTLWPVCLIFRQTRRVEPLPEDYPGWCAGQKITHLRERAAASRYPRGKLPFRLFRPEALRTFRHLEQVMDHTGDVRHSLLGPKPIHPYGVGATVRLEKLSREEAQAACANFGLSPAATARALGNAAGGNQPLATGLLAGGRAIMRCSIALPVRNRRPAGWLGSFTPGLALKFPLDGAASCNVLAMLTLEGQGDNPNYFAATLATILPAPRRLHTAFLTTLFDAVESSPLDLPVARLAQVQRDGSAVEQPWIPSQLHFVPTPASTGRLAAAPGPDLRQDLEERFQAGDVLYTVFAVTHPGQAGIPILKLVLDSAFIASRFDDEELNFQHPRKNPPPPRPTPGRELVARLNKLILDAAIWFFTVAFAIKTLLNRGRATHTYGVGARGELVVAPAPAFPPHPFFRAGRRFAFTVRHASATNRDDAGKGFFGIALRLRGDQPDEALDLLANTSPRDVFWHARNFFRIVIAEVLGQRVRQWVDEHTPPMWAHSQLGARRAPACFTRLYYYAHIAFHFHAEDGWPRLARFRVAPEDLAPDVEGLPEGADRLQSTERRRLPDEIRPADYLRAGFLQDLAAGRTKRMRLQIQWLDLKPDLPNSIYSTAVSWDPLTHPWVDVGLLTYTAPMAELETEALQHRIFNQPPSLAVPAAEWISDFRSIGYMRTKVYPRVQAWRRFLGRVRGRLGPGDYPLGEDLQIPHGIVTVMMPVAAGREPALAQLLAEIGQRVDEANELPLAGMDEVHFARFSIVPGRPAEAGRAGTPAQLLYAADVDGRPETHLYRLSRSASVLPRILAHCTGFPPEGDVPATAAAYRYLYAHRTGYRTAYEGVVAHTVRRIRAEDRLRSAIDSFLDEGQRAGRWPALEPLAIVEEVRRHVQSRPDLPQAPVPPPTLGQQIRRLARQIFPLLAPLVLLGAAGWALSHWLGGWAWLVLGAALLALAGTALAVLRRAERLEPEFDSAHLAPSRVQDLASREDYQVQNQLTMILPLKATWFRPWLLRQVLRAANYAARYLFFRGSLFGLSTIHFARFWIDPASQRMVFLSNYDGNWEEYLDDFLSVGRLAVVPIWTNLAGCPQTRWLVQPTPGFGPKFKAFIRHYQIPTQVWYSGYRDLTVTNILNNSAIRDGLWQVRTPAAARRWLALFSR